MVTPKASENYKKYKAMIDTSHLIDSMKDTVGAVSICKDQCAAGVSSGGLAMKMPGRIGEAALYGAGCWAEVRNENLASVSISGTGELIMKHLLAKQISDLCFEDYNLEGVLRTVLENFLESEISSVYNEKAVGFILLRLFQGECQLWYGHTTASFVYGYKSNQSKVSYFFLVFCLPQAGKQILYNWMSFPRSNKTLTLLLLLFLYLPRISA